MRNESLGAERGKLELSSENFVHSSSAAAADQVEPHSTFTLAAGLHRNRGMSRASFFVCCRARRVDKVTTISMCVVWDISPGQDLFTLARDGKCAFWGPTGDPTSLNSCRSCCRCDRRRRRRLIGSTCRLNFYTIVFLFSFHFFIVCHPFVFWVLISLSEANRGIVAGALPLDPAVTIAIAKCRDANARIVTKYRIYIFLYIHVYI